MSTISITGLASRLEKKFKRLGVNTAQSRALVLKGILSSIAKTWRAEIKAKLLKPASSRGYTKRSLNPHNSLRYNDGFPMSVSGQLANAVWQKVSIRNNSQGAIINIAKGISPVLNSSGKDYGSILNLGGRNEANRVLKDFKKRAFDLLDRRITSVALKKGYR